MPSLQFPSKTIHLCVLMFLLSEGIDSLEQFFDTQLQNLMQVYPVKSNSKGTNTNNESDILIKSLMKEFLYFKKNSLIKKTPSKSYL